MRSPPVPTLANLGVTSADFPVGELAKLLLITHPLETSVTRGKLSTVLINIDNMPSERRSKTPLGRYGWDGGKRARIV